MALKLKSKSDDAVDLVEPAAPGQYEWPSAAKPSAMLVPTYIRENRSLAITKRQVFFGMVVTVALVVLAVAGAFLANVTSKSALDDALAHKESAQSKVRALAPIADYYDGLEERSKATVALLSNDVRHADLLTFVNSSMPAGTTLTSYSTTFGTPCLGDDPFTATNSIGCISIGADTDSRDKVAAAIESLQRQTESPMIQGAFVTNVEASKDGVRFTINMNFTPDSLSMKYVPNPPDAQATPATETQDGTQ